MRNLQIKIQITLIALFLSTFSFAQCPDGYTSVGVNLSFELPIMGCDNPSYIIIDDNYLPGWRSTSNGGNGKTCNNEDNEAYTTPGQNNVELWMDGFLGKDAVEGNQFMEINAHAGGTIYQDFILGADCYDVFWSVNHRGRNGVDSIRIVITDGITNYVDQIVGTDKTAWAEYQGVFTTNDVTTNLTMQLISISTHGNKASVGNLVDDIKLCVRELGCNQLPVEMVSFTADNKEETVELEWLTASELDNAGFEVERSEDGQNWETLDFVKGNGTTEDASFYNWTDYSPVNGTSYYRLKQIDTNGTYEYSKVVSVERNNNSSIEFNVYPNPTRGQINYNTPSEAHTVVLFDAFGKQIRTWEVGAEKTNNEISIEDQPAGIYMISIQYNGTVNTQKVVKK